MNECFYKVRESTSRPENGGGNFANALVKSF